MNGICHVIVRTLLYFVKKNHTCWCQFSILVMKIDFSHNVIDYIIHDHIDYNNIN